MIALIPALAISSTLSANGKKASEARNYIIITSSYGEAYTQLYVKYNRMIGRANEVDMNDLDAVDSKK